ncbi:uncharacterized protein LOC131934580 [Physella acuta]|uniref:uncharacterized protein LOC131934580 n=1 Tax=Physella acuta TaxID=109671 RepID=UPI0027DDD15A|nr:uncharacterized protein LOC131934580 [Physella acuta]
MLKTPIEMDGWIPVNIRRQRHQAPRATTQASHIHLHSAEGIDMATYHFEIERKFAKPNHQLLYHGTSLTFSASILHEGIDLTQGNPQQNYSHNYGFYLYFDFQRALSWAKKRFPKDYVVLIFQVPNILLNSSINKGLLLNACDGFMEMALWKTIVQYCRSGYTINTWVEMVLEDLNFIQGPACSNLGPFLKRGKEPKFFKTDGHVSQQICIRKNDYAKKFEAISDICGIVAKT